MDEPFLNSQEQRMYPVRAISNLWEGICTLCPLVLAIVSFAYIAHTHTLARNISNNQDTLLIDHVHIIDNIQLLANKTIDDDTFTHHIYDKLENLYTVAKIVCQLYPQYKDYCKLLA